MQSLSACKYFDVRPKLFQTEDQARFYLQVQSDWDPFDDSLPLEDSVARTYFWFVPRPHNSDRPLEDAGVTSFREFCKESELPDLEVPTSFRDLLAVWSAAMPCWTVVHSHDAPKEVRLAYLALLLTDFSQARKLKFIDVAKTKAFLKTENLEDFVRTLVKTRQNKVLEEFTEDAPGPWMSYKYWLHNGNLFERDTQHVLALVFRANRSSRLPNSKLLELCKICIHEQLYVKFEPC